MASPVAFAFTVGDKSRRSGFSVKSEFLGRRLGPFPEFSKPSAFHGLTAEGI